MSFSRSREFPKLLFTIAMENWWRSRSICAHANNFWKCWGRLDCGRSPGYAVLPNGVLLNPANQELGAPDSALCFSATVEAVRTNSKTAQTEVCAPNSHPSMVISPTDARFRGC